MKGILSKVARVRKNKKRARIADRIETSKCTKGVDCFELLKF
jgi:hypothetical protein